MGAAYGNRGFVIFHQLAEKLGTGKPRDSLLADRLKFEIALFDRAGEDGTVNI